MSGETVAPTGNGAATTRFTIALGVLALVSPVFDLSHSSNTNFVAVHGAGMVTFAVVGLITLLGVITEMRLLVVAAGAVSLAAGVLQFVQFGRSTNWMEGNGSTAALFLGLALGLLVVGLLHEEEAGPKQP